MKLIYEFVESKWAADPVIRAGIRNLLGKRLKQEMSVPFADYPEKKMAFIRELKGSPVAIATDKANEQHYEIPSDFFKIVLGPRMKYSCCWWDDSVDTLQQSEEKMLAMTCMRAELEDGMHILELGCGWGSLTLWMAEQYPKASITAVSNSTSQRQWIEGQAAQRGFSNIRVITEDMNTFSIEEKFDRVVSLEMFEHMRNYQELLNRISGWLKPGGKLFVHIFCHKECAYPFQTGGKADWMARHFFTGGIMPSEDLLLFFQDDVTIEKLWRVNGQHYEKTLLAWLALQDQHKETIMPMMQSVYGADDAERWFQRWRIFFMACAELFGYNRGEEWYVAHYLFKK